MENKILEIGNSLKEGFITKNEAKKELANLLGVTEPLKKEAKECLVALSCWDEKHLKDGIYPYHTLKTMRPMILAKKILNNIINNLN